MYQGQIGYVKAVDIMDNDRSGWYQLLPDDSGKYSLYRLDEFGTIHDGSIRTEDVSFASDGAVRKRFVVEFVLPANIQFSCSSFDTGAANEYMNSTQMVSGLMDDIKRFKAILEDLDREEATHTGALSMIRDVRQQYNGIISIIESKIAAAGAGRYIFSRKESGSNE